MSVSPASKFQLTRLGVLMEPEHENPLEAWGVLNPASARHEGELYLFPRVVAEGNYSRIGMARVVFEDGNPMGVERMGCVLEPQEPYERAAHHGGGVEDPRITWIEELGVWVMAYVGLSNLGPRIALAISKDLFHWDRLGLLQYELSCGVDFGQYGNKDGMFFPEPVMDAAGKPALAILHRPTYLVHRPDGAVFQDVPCDAPDDRESIWIAYVSLDEARRDIRTLAHVHGCELVATPHEPWEALKIGGGTPPIRIPQGWLTFYHGVQGTYSTSPGVPKHVVYSAGAMVLDSAYPTKVLYRSREPVLVPRHQSEQHGIVPNVVFPTAIDAREKGRLDIYYGAADSTIAVARTEVPRTLE